MSARCGKHKVSSKCQRRPSVASAFAELMDELLSLRSQVRDLRRQLSKVTAERNRFEEQLCGPSLPQEACRRTRPKNRRELTDDGELYAD